MKKKIENYDDGDNSYEKNIEDVDINVKDDDEDNVDDETEWVTNSDLKKTIQEYGYDETLLDISSSRIDDANSVNSAMDDEQKGTMLNPEQQQHDQTIVSLQCNSVQKRCGTEFKVFSPKHFSFFKTKVAEQPRHIQNMCCWWDAHPLSPDEYPKSLPVKYIEKDIIANHVIVQDIHQHHHHQKESEKSTRKTRQPEQHNNKKDEKQQLICFRTRETSIQALFIGYFCSWSCAHAYDCKWNKNDNHFKIQKARKDIDGIGMFETPLFASPPCIVLENFGGDMSITDYRNMWKIVEQEKENKISSLTKSNDTHHPKRHQHDFPFSNVNYHMFDGSSKVKIIDILDVPQCVQMRHTDQQSKTKGKFCILSNKKLKWYSSQTLFESSSPSTSSYNNSKNTHINDDHLRKRTTENGDYHNSKRVKSNNIENTKPSRANISRQIMQSSNLPLSKSRVKAIRDVKETDHCSFSLKKSKNSIGDQTNKGPTTLTTESLKGALVGHFKKQ